MEELTNKERVQAPYHHIDPGFINRRLCFSTFGRILQNKFEDKKTKGDDHWTQLQNDHLLVDLCLASCRGLGVQSLGEVLSDVHEGMLFCSTENVKGTDAVYEEGRTEADIILPYEIDQKVTIEFGTEHFVASTTRSEVAMGAKVSLIGGIRHLSSDYVVAYPLIIGAPSFDHPWNQEFIVEPDRLVWYGWDWYEIFADDIDEFSKIREIEDPEQKEWESLTSGLSEEFIKGSLCEILGDLPRKDWGGEQADHFSASVRLSGDRVTAGFLLKGPSQFREMTPEMLGKRADQIYRLACTPADLLIVQHCHQIGEAVRATLRAFSVTPHNPRRYCLIDGKDTYRILSAYGKI